MTNAPLFIEQSRRNLGTMDSCGSYPFEALEYDTRSGYTHVIERADLERVIQGQLKRALQVSLVFTSPEGQTARVVFKVVRLTVDPSESPPYWQDRESMREHKSYCRSRCVVRVLEVTPSI